MAKTKQPSSGDHVRVSAGKDIYEGMLMPRPEMLGDGYIVVKLGSGYNIGIDKKRIDKIDMLSEYKKKLPDKKKLADDPKLPTVSVLSFGGTISSKIDYRTGGVYADYTAEDFVAMCPELGAIANLKAKKVMGIMSEDMAPEDWRQMAKAIHKELESGVAGVVCSQGTDTLHFSTAAMAFMLKDLDRPVVFTASQRSIDRGSSDAFMNLICAVTAAARWDGAEVVTCLHGTTDDDYCILNRGTRVRKMHTSRRDAFRPIGQKPLAKVFADGKIEATGEVYDLRRKDAKVRLANRFEEKTALIYVYPGMDPEIIDHYVKKGYRGIVVAATALGHVPTNNTKHSIISNLKKAIDAGVVVAIATQTIYGRVHPHVYSNLRKLSISLGCIYCQDMLAETAYVKLGWALGQEKDQKKVRELMEKGIAHEITERSDTDSFLY